MMVIKKSFRWKKNKSMCFVFQAIWYASPLDPMLLAFHVRDYTLIHARRTPFRLLRHITFDVFRPCRFGTQERLCNTWLAKPKVVWHGNVNDSFIQRNSFRNQANIHFLVFHFLPALFQLDFGACFVQLGFSLINCKKMSKLSTYA